MRLLTLQDIAYRLNLPLLGFPLGLIPVKGFQVDSRAIKAGEVFVALKGEKVDGHEFLEMAREKGAAGAIVSKTFKGRMEDFPLLFVENPLFALQELARDFLKESGSRVVAITGSVGKTSSKEFTKTLLANKYKVAASPGNQNSQVGVSLTILNHTDGTEDLLILEMGMSEAGELSRLVEITTPEVAMITNVSLVHACNFHSVEDIARAKGEIFSNSQTKLGILHREIPIYSEIAQIGKCDKISFSAFTSNADYEMSDDLNIHARLENKSIPGAKLQLPGKHNRDNLLGAIAIARYYEIEWESIIQTVPSLQLPQKRLQFVKHKGITFLNDSYNASEITVKAALEVISTEPHVHGRRIAVLGSMLELGRYSLESHVRIGHFALQHVERMYCLGSECEPIVDIWKKAGKPVHLFQSREELVSILNKELKKEDFVLLKGSNSHQLWKILDEL